MSSKDQQGTLSRLWSQPCGTRDVLKLSLPLVISTLSYTVMQFCDRMFLSWHSVSELAAVLPVAVLTWTLISLPLGLASYATTFVAQYFGAGQPEKIGPVVWQSIRIGLATIPVFALVAWFAPVYFLAAGHEPPRAALESTYFRTLVMASAGSVLNAGLNAYFIGQGRTMIVMIVNIIAAALNILLDWVMIFGHFGCPEMGIYGAGIATSIAIWMKVAAYALLIFFGSNAALNGVFSGWRFDWTIMKRLIRFGAPNGLQMFIEGLAISVFSMAIAAISEEAVAACSIAFSINMVAFIPVIGLGMGVSTLVGQQIGKGNPDLGARATWHGFVIGLVYTAFFAAIYVFLPDRLISLFEPKDEPLGEVRGLSILMLRFVAVYCLFDTVQIIFVSAIKGAGDTMFVVLTTVVVSIAFVAFGCYGAIRFSDQQSLVNWWWLSLTGLILVFAIAYLLRFLQGKWRSMKVIEVI